MNERSREEKRQHLFNHNSFYNSASIYKDTQKRIDKCITINN